jgi:hypothetical protein
LYTLTHHARARMDERGIRLDDIEAALTRPEVTYPSRNRRGAVTVFEASGVRVVVGDHDLIVTVTLKETGR